MPAADRRFWIALCLLVLPLGVAVRPVCGQDVFSLERTERPRAYARQRFEDAEVGVKGLARKQLETSRGGIGATGLGLMQGRFDSPPDQMLVWVRRWRDAVCGCLEPGPVQDRQLAGIWLVLWKVKEWHREREQAGSLWEEFWWKIHWEQLRFEHELGQDGFDPDAPSLDAKVCHDYTAGGTAPIHRLLGSGAQARFNLSQIDPVRRNQELLETARKGWKVALRTFLLRPEPGNMVPLLGWLGRLAESEQLVKGKEPSRRELLERQWLGWLGVERYSQPEGQMTPIEAREPRSQLLVALAGEARPAVQRRACWSLEASRIAAAAPASAPKLTSARPVVPQAGENLEERWVIQACFAASRTSPAVLRQQFLQTAEANRDASLRAFLQGRSEIPIHQVLLNGYIERKAAAELRGDQADPPYLALLRFRLAYEVEQLAQFRFNAGSMSLQDLLTARLKRIAAAVHLLRAEEVKRRP